MSSGSQNERRRFKPKATKKSFVDSVLEVIDGSNSEKTSSIALDSCFHLNGELMSIPQTEEEENLMDQTLWDYLLKKTGNNLTHIVENYLIRAIYVAGITDPAFSDPGKPAAGESRELFFPKDGFLNLVHPITGLPLNPYAKGEMLWPASSSYWENTEFCIACQNSLKKRNKKNWWQNRLKSWCSYVFCNQLSRNAFICVFDEKPTFTLRGLCKEEVMDTQYKFAEHGKGSVDWGRYDGAAPRDYVGPKGWVISQNMTDDVWTMSHYFYTSLTLTMVDKDMLPVGRHKWKVENNVCNEGETSYAVLLLSGCKEGEFTCDDGKCLDITQRCNSIEVSCCTLITSSLGGWGVGVLYHLP